jgi:hypothetical protein
MMPSDRSAAQARVANRRRAFRRHHARNAREAQLFRWNKVEPRRGKREAAAQHPMRSSGRAPRPGRQRQGKIDIVVVGEIGARALLEKQAMAARTVGRPENE